MVTTLQETDTAAVDGSIAACSGLSADVAMDNRQISFTGSGGTQHSITSSSADTALRDIHFETAPGALDTYACPAGNWTVRINITGANTNIQWTDLWICRLNSAGVNQQTIASTNLQTITLSAGVKSVTLAGIATSFAKGDKIYIVVGFTNGVASNQNVQYTPDQLIDTPLIQTDFRFWGSSGGVGVFQTTKPLAA